MPNPPLFNPENAANHMQSRLNYILVSILLFFLLLEIGLQFGYQPELGLKRHEEKLEQYLQQAIHELEIDFKTQHTLQRFENEHMPLESASRLSHLLWYGSDSLVAWAQPTGIPLPNFPIKKALPKNKLIEINHIIYFYYHQDTAALKAIGLIPVYYRSVIEGEYTNSHFPKSLDFPEALALSFSKTDYELNNHKGEILAYLKYKDAYTPPLLLGFHIFIYLIIILILFYLSHKLTWHLSHRSPWMGFGALIGLILVLRGLVINIWTSRLFHADTFIHRMFEIPVLNSSLGILLINIIFLLWLILFSLKVFPKPQISQPPIWLGVLINTFNYGMISLGLCLIIGSFKNIIQFSEIPFDFDNVFNLNIYSLIAIFELILLLLVLFLLSHRVVSAIIQISPNRGVRFGAFLLAIFILSPLLSNFWPGLPIQQVLLWAFIWCIILDFYVDSGGTGLSWLILWLILFSGFAAFFTNAFSIEKDQQQRIQYAQVLIQPNDSLLLYHLESFKADFYKEIPTKEDLKAFFEEKFHTNTYILNNYTWEIQPLSTNKITSDVISNISYKVEGVGLGYSARVLAILDNNTRFQILFQAKYQQQSPALASLELDAPFKNLDQIESYNYAVYSEGQLEYSNAPLSFTKVVDPAILPPSGQFKIRVIGDEYSDLIYKNLEDQVVILRKQTGGFIKPVSLFSYLFGLLFLLSPLLALLNFRFSFLPEEIKFALSMDLPLSGKIQLGILAVILTSFIFIGWLTSWYFQKSAALNQEKLASQRIQNILTDLGQQIGKSDTIIWPSIVQNLSQEARQDLYIYNQSGQLVYTANQALSQIGLRSFHMPALPFVALKLKGYQRVISNERIGKLQHQVIYVPVNLNSNTLAGFLGIPFFSEYRQTQTRTADFIATLVNVYVFLLLIAGAVAIGVANSITRPLQDLSQRLHVLKLGKNEPLEWKSNDELGALIQAYNQMLLKLEESTNKLAQSERESAWREMAKQVAHEIKNPLTPMKLSIQYLQHAFRSQPERAEGLIQQVSTTLVEQIDALSKIASEFSAFAKMPKAQFSHFSVNDLLQAVHYLFSQESKRIAFSLDIPAQDYTIHFDKDQLMRVFNNIYKNAIQAIPEDHQGEIHTSLSEQNGRITIQISDNGTGIPEDMQDKVFVPNFTTKSSGTGLGLAMAKNIIESANGKIYFKTELGVGTDFFVEVNISDK